LSQQSGRAGRHDDEQRHPPERLAAGRLGRQHREVGEEPGLLEDPDDDQHCEQQEDDVPVDTDLGGEGRGVGVDKAQERHGLRRAARGPW
jgi:hypothetical protein